MANQISLTQSQLAELNQITSGGSGNFPAAYRYIYDLIKNNPNVDNGTKYFFKGAAEVNANLRTNANEFIRRVTESGLAWDGKLEADKAAQIQRISDAIATNVFRQIDTDGGIPTKRGGMP
jgi:hypothetical protein